VIRLVLPCPPSTNNLFRNTSAKERAMWAKRGAKPKSRVPTPEYDAWRQLAGLKANLQHQEPLTGRVTVTLRCPEASRRDLENFAKAPIDLLVAHGLIEDDRNRIVRGLTMVWQSETPDLVVEVAPA
jgi:crossover junction endodeoxyribonuclease RusA